MCLAPKVHPDEIAPTAKGRETIVRTLSNLSQVAIGLAELRNEYGPDHGRTRRTSAMRPRHTHLAIGAAQTYCRFLLETGSPYGSSGVLRMLSEERACSRRPAGARRPLRTRASVSFQALQRTPRQRPMHLRSPRGFPRAV